MRLCLLVLLILMAACSPGRSGPSGKRTTTLPGGPLGDLGSGKAQTSFVAMNWTPNEIDVNCAAERCPLQVGALIFVGATASGQIPTRRCTAFMISADTVVSNGHCDGFGKEKGYFVTQRMNGQKHVRAVTGVSYKRFTPHPEGAEFHSGRPDVALFSLDQPIRQVPGLRLANGPQKIFNKLITFAIMKTSGNSMSIERHECHLRRHEAEFPFEISEAPDMIRAYGCRLLPGTSGSPMFAEGSEEVQAVQTSGLDPVNRAKNVQQKESRGLLPHERHWSSLSTNVRCLEVTGTQPIKCAVADHANIGRRFREAQQSEFESLKTRELPTSDPYVKFRAYRYQLSPPRDLRFEMVHLPKCRKTTNTLRSVPIVIEQVLVQIDEWGSPRTQSLSVQILNAVVRSISGDVHEMEMAWPASAMPYANSEADLRKLWGDRFRIDLPECPR